MSSTQEFVQFLHQSSRDNSLSFISTISQGDELQRSGSLKYVIEDSDVDRQLGELEDGAIPYTKIFNHFKDGKQEVLKVVKGRDIFPFLELFDTQVGQCFERSIVTQLAAQRTRDAYMVNGIVTLDGRCGIDEPAFNLIVKENQLFLVDTSLPVGYGKDGSYEKPFIAPFLTIQIADRKIILPEEFMQGRAYSIF
jgi:hypothetical protein